jgi:hypothetical protein
LKRVQAPPERMAFALCRVLGEREAETTRDYLRGRGYTVLRSAIHGRALSETRQQSLNTAAREMMLDLLDRALSATAALEVPARAT